MFSKSFLSEIKSLALKIALHQRGERQMQHFTVLSAKFGAEMQELAKTFEQWDELPDVGYYAACLQITTDELSVEDPGYSLASLSSEIEKRGVSLTQLEAGTLAKYRLRVANLGTEQPKDIEAERVAILSAIDPTKHGMRLYGVAEIFKTGWSSKRDDERVALYYAESKEALMKRLLANQVEEEEQYYKYEIEEVDFEKLLSGERQTLYYHDNR